MPTERTVDAKRIRNALFDQFDVTGRRMLSLADVERGCREVLNLNELVCAGPVVELAFLIAREVNCSGLKEALTETGNLYVERSEFRVLLVYLRQHMELYEMFQKIDVDGSRRINFEKFKRAIPLLEGWGLKKNVNALEEFSSIDRDGSGTIDFAEFADWALKNNLDLRDDDDFDDDVLELARTSSKPLWESLGEKHLLEQAAAQKLPTKSPVRSNTEVANRPRTQSILRNSLPPYSKASSTQSKK